MHASKRPAAYIHMNALFAGEETDLRPDGEQRTPG